MPHIHDLIDFTVSAAVVHDGKVLMVHHKQLNLWLFVGGHVELNEDPEQAILREAKEESGLDIELVGTRPPVDDGNVRALIAPAFLNIHRITDRHQHVDLVYVARASTRHVTLAEREHHDIRWFLPEELEDPQYQIQRDLKFYAREALRMTGR